MKENRNAVNQRHTLQSNLWPV